MEKHPERFERLKEWQKDARKKRKVHWNTEARKSAIMLISSGNPKCIKCGCDDFRLLEINHKHGGGGKEFKIIGAKFYSNIISMKRPTTDLEILCKVCNALHALELKYGLLPFQIKWTNKSTHITIEDCIQHESAN